MRIRRLLPSRERQRVGPFIFLEHFGPEDLPRGTGVDVRPHPHIGLATVTYLFEGELLHRGSLGSSETIRPGEINWMHAGRGIVHSERTPAGLREAGSRIHGLQLWVALPSDLETTAPDFRHYSTADLPEISVDGARVRVLAGEAFGQTSPVRTGSETLCIDVALGEARTLEAPDAEERGLYVADGAVAVGAVTLTAGQLLVLPDGAAEVRALTASRVAVLGGARLEGDRHIWWNFVSSSPEAIERARRDWTEGRFPSVPGEAPIRAAVSGQGVRSGNQVRTG
jgi:redox-sensitive bicupin YhaK (pirin superfamily)